MLINSIVGVLSQCILILKYFVHFRYIINLFVSHITIKLKKQIVCIREEWKNIS